MAVLDKRIVVYFVCFGCEEKICLENYHFNFLAGVIVTCPYCNHPHFIFDDPFYQKEVIVINMMCPAAIHN